MRLQTQLYVTSQGCRDGEATRALMRAATKPLDDLYQQGVIAGYQLSVLETEDDYEDKDLDRPLIEGETGGALPVLFLNVTYRIDRSPPDTAAIDPVILEFAFRHLLTESDVP
jgi:hypothetical protein